MDKGNFFLSNISPLQFYVYFLGILNLPFVQKNYSRYPNVNVCMVYSIKMYGEKYLEPLIVLYSSFRKFTLSNWNSVYCIICK